MSDFLQQLKRARLFGHPIHSMLVHFPSALFPIGLVFDVLALLLQNHCLACAAFYSYLAGVLLGFAAALVGTIDYARLPGSHNAWNKASLHALLSTTWLVVFAIVVGLKFKQFPEIGFGTAIEIGLSAIAVIGLIYSNFLGGDLVFRHKLGFDETEK